MKKKDNLLTKVTCKIEIGSASPLILRNLKLKNTFHAKPEEVVGGIVTFLFSKYGMLCVLTSVVQHTHFELRRKLSPTGIDA